MRAMSALLGQGVRVAVKARRGGRRVYERREGLRMGFGAMRAEALAATPREVACLRATREAQQELELRLSGCASRGVVEACASRLWKWRVACKDRWRGEVYVDEVWLGGHIRLWRLAGMVRAWAVRSWRRRKGAMVGLVEAMVTEEEMGEALYEEATSTVNTLEALERSHGEARRRVGVLVCGLFYSPMYPLRKQDLASMA